jgi:Ca-activated chloride channel family protein
MRIVYSKWEGLPPGKRPTFKQLLRLFNHLLLQTGGNVEEALRWMERLGKRYKLFGKDMSFEKFVRELEEQGIIRAVEGEPELTRKGERIIREDALSLIFSSLAKSTEGEHRTPHEGTGTDKLTETRPYRFGDAVSDIDGTQTLTNALRRGGIDDILIREEDLEIFETEHHTSCATVLLLDVSHSMILYGEDRITPAKIVALALTELILRRFKKDALHVVLFGDEAVEVKPDRLPYVEAGPFHTNTRDGLRLAQRILERLKHTNKQIFMITDGKPSAIREGGRIYQNPFGLDRRIVNKTLEEAAVCRRKRIPITTFMVADDPLLVRFVEELTRVNRGRAYYTQPGELGRFVFVDYIKNRRRNLSA